MHSLDFPYTRLGALFLPIVPVTIISRHVAFRTDAYVDSGAFYSIFRSEIMDSLGLRKEQGRLKLLKAADGKVIGSYLFRLTLEIGTVKLRPLIAFSDQLNVGFNLLGRHTVFSSFDEVAFNEKRKTVSFRLLN
ncbi:MAG: hypothetical protein WCH75_31590 [Candidatus Binatia bacterium]